MQKLRRYYTLPAQTKILPRKFTFFGWKGDRYTNVRILIDKVYMVCIQFCEFWKSRNMYTVEFWKKDVTLKAHFAQFAVSTKCYFNVTKWTKSKRSKYTKYYKNLHYQNDFELKMRNWEAWEPERHQGTSPFQGTVLSGETWKSKAKLKNWTKNLKLIT